MDTPDIWRTFERRKEDHLRLSLSERVQADENRLDRIGLDHHPLPELALDDVDLTCESLGGLWPTPFFVSSMTAGHSEGTKLNVTLARVCEDLQWPMGVGSQRRELRDCLAAQEWVDLKHQFPKLKLLGNIGLSQLISEGVAPIVKIIESLNPIAFFIHTNPLQESLQVEGTPNFRGGIKVLEELCTATDTPIILKETGCGFSSRSLEAISHVPLYAVDVSGFGGTHWGKIEGLRAAEEISHEAWLRARAAETFASWGISTVDSLLACKALKAPWKVWASGGVRNGLDGAKLLNMGAQHVGVAGQVLKAAVRGEEHLKRYLQLLEFELKVAYFNTGSRNGKVFCREQLWHWRGL